MSTAECTTSDRIAALPVTLSTMNLAIAIAALATMASWTAIFDSAVAQRAG